MLCLDTQMGTLCVYYASVFSGYMWKGSVACGRMLLKISSDQNGLEQTYDLLAILEKPST
jgi:hypothetical protein